MTKTIVVNRDFDFESVDVVSVTLIDANYMYLEIKA